MRHCLLLAFVQLAPIFVCGTRQVLPPAFCSQLLEETYGALRGWTPSQPQLLGLCSGLMVKKLRMARTTAAAHGPCTAFATSISSRRAEIQDQPLPSLAMLKVDWCGAHPHVSPQPPPQRRILSAPPAPARQPHKQAFVNLDDQDKPKVSSNSASKPAAPLHVLVQHGGKEHHHHHHQPKPQDWQSLTDRDALLRARDAILNGGDDSAAMAAASSSSVGASPTPVADSNAGSEQKHTAALVGAHQAKPAGHRQGFLAASIGFVSGGAAWAKEEMLSTLDFMCDGQCGIQRKPVSFEIRG